MASRPHQDVELDGVKFHFEALSFEKATDILADVTYIVSKTLDSGIGRVTDMFKSGRVQLGQLMSTSFKDIDPKVLNELLLGIAPVLITISGELAQERGGVNTLKWLESKLLDNSTAIIRDEKGGKERLDLIDKADRAKLYEAHPSTYFLSLFLAGKVTFARFFPGAGAAAAGSTHTSAAAASPRDSDKSE